MVVELAKNEFAGKTAMVTGAASGMGLLSAKCFYERGANVVLIDCNESALQKAVKSFAGGAVKALPLVCDVRHFCEVEAVVKKAIETFGALDIMVNCAGGCSSRIFNDWAEFCDRPMEEIQWGMEVNLMGVIYFCHEAMRQMRAQKSGSIVNFGSITGIEGDTSGTDYSISKSAIMNGLNKSLAQEGARYGVRVNCVAPGPVLTRPGMAGMKTPLGRAADPQEIVDMVLYLASERSSFVTGSMFLMDGGRHLMTND